MSKSLADKSDRPCWQGMGCLASSGKGLRNQDL